jgi:hypothetical protein
MLDQKVTTTERDGIVSGIIAHTADITERALTSGFSLANDLRAELFTQRALSAIAWLESAQQGAIRLSRGFVEQTDRLSADVLRTSEDILVGIVHTLKKNGQGVANVVGESVRSTISAGGARANGPQS